MTIHNCVKCGSQFDVNMIPKHDSREWTLVKDNPPKLFCKLQFRKQFTKCELCRNMAKALNYINTVISQ